MVVAIDAKRRADGSGWNIYKNGGRVDMGLDALEWVEKAERLGAGEILLTSMDCDGTKAGYDLELTRAVSQAVKIPVIASGGRESWNIFTRRWRTPERRLCWRHPCSITRRWKSG